jgi:glycosyltransferase involved in cell wall biosynthesis
MKEFRTYVEKAQTAKMLSEFPAKKDVDYTVAIVLPESNTAEGIYKSLLPAFHLNRLTTIRVLPLNITPQIDSIGINEKGYEIKAKLCKVADHIVWPFVSYPIAGEIEEARKHNPKVKISYYIDFNYYNLPDSYPFVEQYGKAEHIANIEKNIIAADQVIVTNRELYKFLGVELSGKEGIKGCGTEICMQPLFFDRKLFPKLTEKEKPKSKKVRFGMVLNHTHFSDLSFIKGILKEFFNAHKNEAELVVLGWNGVYKDKNYLSNLNAEYHPPVNFFDYPEKLKSLNIDCFIIPAKNNKFNQTSKNIVKFYEFSALNIPIIAPNIDAYRDVIEQNGNGVLCDTKEEWKFELETFLKAREKYEDFADRAYASLIDHDISDKSSIETLMGLYEI